MLDDYKKCDKCHQIIKIDEYHSCASSKTDSYGLSNLDVLNQPLSLSTIRLMNPTTALSFDRSNCYDVDIGEIIEKLENDLKSEKSSGRSTSSLYEQEQRKNSRLKKEIDSLNEKQLHDYKIQKVELDISKLIIKNLMKQLENSKS